MENKEQVRQEEKPIKSDTSLSVEEAAKAGEMIERRLARIEEALGLPALD